MSLIRPRHSDDTAARNGDEMTVKIEPATDKEVEEWGKDIGSYAYVKMAARIKADAERVRYLESELKATKNTVADMQCGRAPVPQTFIGFMGDTDERIKAIFKRLTNLETKATVGGYFGPCNHQVRTFASGMCERCGDFAEPKTASALHKEPTTGTLRAKWTELDVEVNGQKFVPVTEPSVPVSELRAIQRKADRIGGRYWEFVPVVIAAIADAIAKAEAAAIRWEKIKE